MNENSEGEIILIDKPLTWTSFDVVKKVRNILKVKKVGHAGTLDPLATGLLIVCTDKKTKLIQGIQDAEKEYTGTFFIGAETPSFDRETEISEKYPIDHISFETIINAAKKLTGEIEQVPPAHSAVKLNGRRAYEMARKGEMPEIKSRKVVISEFEITRFELPEVDFRIVCSKGTYIRSVARDIGKLLNSGAFLYSLRRTRIGAYNLTSALTPELLAESRGKRVDATHTER